MSIAIETNNLNILQQCNALLALNIQQYTPYAGIFQDQERLSLENPGYILRRTILAVVID
ncbi:hypothetical protein NQ317_007440 [Molorchus minor]|uniref:Uncharacterized protein n=1 Tax=Molorchus minor TaxID=1323400 RepID=A0ABQ9JGW9_9CUCU|nr:hypothetical protein NQ317_007440 [Molorchus minor]